MAEIDPAVRQRFAAGAETVDVLVSVRDRDVLTEPGRLEWVPKRVFAHIPVAAGAVTRADLEDLARCSAVLTVELDGTMNALPEPGPEA